MGDIPCGDGFLYPGACSDMCGAPYAADGDMRVGHECCSSVADEIASLRSALSAAREEARARSEEALDVTLRLKNAERRLAEAREEARREREQTDVWQSQLHDTAAALHLAKEEARRLTGERDAARAKSKQDEEWTVNAMGRERIVREKLAASESSARRLREAMERKDVALRAANAAMNHMGDVLNEMDAVEPEDEEKTSVAFALVRIEIGEAMPGDEERARAALGSSPVDTEGETT